MVAQEDEPEVVPDDACRQWGPATTFNDAIAGWKLNGWQDLSPLTAARYESVWKLHIKADIGKRRIASVGPYDVERYFRKLKSNGAGRETVRYVRSVLHRACRLARKWSGNTLPNPVADTELPVYSSAETPDAVRAPSADEVVAVLVAAVALDVRYAIGLRIVAATGMRRGEACGLRWSDVDFDRSTLSINQSAIPAAGGAAIKSPKTRASIRQVAIDPGTLESLRSLRETQEELARFAGVELPPGSFVLSVVPGGTTALHPDTLSKAFAKARKSAKVAAEIHLHSLRHFQASSTAPAAR